MENRLRCLGLLAVAVSLADKFKRAPEQHGVAICIGITVAAMVVITVMAIVGKVLRARAQRASLFFYAA